MDCTRPGFARAVKIDEVALPDYINIAISSVSYYYSNFRHYNITNIPHEHTVQLAALG